LVSKSLASVEERLDPNVFFRAGNRHILNLRWIQKVDTSVAGNLEVTLQSGHSIEMSRRQSARLRDTLSL
jgi:two-component system, LytTR family, response regulator